MLPKEVIEELDFIFYDNKELAKDHENIAEFIHLLHENIKLQEEDQEKFTKINEKIQKVLEKITTKNNKK